MPNFIRRKYVWLMEKPWCIFSVVLLSVTVSFAVVWPGPIVDKIPSDLRLRVWGMVLQLIGIATVAFDLLVAARNYGRANILGDYLEWFRRGLFGSGHVIHAMTGNATGNSSVSADLRISYTVRRGSLDDQVKFLFENQQRISDELHLARKEIVTARNELKINFEQGQSKIREDIDAVKLDLASGFVGNYGVLIFGIVWLGLGVVLTSIAPEIAKGVAGQWGAIWRAL